MPLIDRHFTIPGESTFDLVDWETGPVEIVKADGTVVYSQETTEFPTEWSKTARQIVASKYFYGQLGEDREYSLKQLISRVVCAISDAGAAEGYFGLGDDDEMETFEDELTAILLSQRASFNSPVWFNIGVEGEVQQASACFINSVEDNMQSILELVKTEGIIFKRGSGAGVNLSSLRGENEALRGGGIASGPVSFMKGYDAFAGVIKSGGKARRAARINILDVDHPDIFQFINSKTKEEEKALALIKAGYDPSIDGEAYSSVFFQNANHSVRVSDEFMELVVSVFDDKPWYLVNRGNGESHAVNAQKLFRSVARAAWRCGDPGLMFADATEAGNTCKNSGHITATNPCQPAQATVLTPNGIRTFADLNVGSVIWTGENWTEVTRKVRTGIKKVYKYKTNAGFFLGTEDHRVLSNGEKVPVGVADTIDIPATTFHYTPPSLGFNPQDVMDGLVLGDGTVKTSNNGGRQCMLLCIGDSDQDYFKSEIAYLIDKYFDHKSYKIKTTVTPNELPYTYKRFIPDHLMQLEAPYTAGVLRGLFSANGSVVGDQRVSLKTASKQMAEDVQLLLSSIGISSYKTTNKSKEVAFGNGTYRCKESYDINICKDRHIFRERVGFIQEYKNKKLDKICTSPVGKKVKDSYDVVEREYMGLMPVYDITVADDQHQYWTGGHVVSNCIEFCWLNDTSCNLASINLMAFYNGEEFNISDFDQTVKVMITAMDILCGMAEYPTEKIAENTLKYRILGLGFTNLGALLMASGMPYDSIEARRWASQTTHKMTSEAYMQSAKIAEVMGPFPAYEDNVEEMEEVLRQQGVEATKYASEHHGFRNAQVTVLAPTGTISFKMDADTTGIEPMLTLTPKKSLVGGGEISVFPKCFEMGLKKLDYDQEARTYIMKHVGDHGHLFDESQLAVIKDEHVSIFATAIGQANTITPEGHLKMLQSCQRYLSGGISKTVNLPSNATVQDVERVYFQAWKLGLKSISIYRDGCKESQPVVSSKDTKTVLPKRRKLPDERPAVTHKFTVGGHKGYLTVGLFDDGTPGEVFVTMAKEGSTISGVMGAFATMISLALQYGIPLPFLIRKFRGSRYEPNGYTGNKEVPYAKSLTDYIFQWLALRFPTGQLVSHKPVEEPAEEPEEVDSSAPFCSECEEQMTATGPCYTCQSCGETTGGCG